MRTLHSTLYFERIDPRVDEIGEDLEDTEISHGDGILLLPLPQADLFSVRVKDGIGKPAGACAPAAVAAPAAEKARHQAPSRVGIAHGAVNKALDLHGFLSLYGPDLFEGQLPGRYDSADAQFLEKADRFGGRAGHLCRGVQLQAGTSVVKRANNAQVLDDHSVQSFPVEGYGKIHRLLQFTLLGEHIEGQIDFLSENMRLFNRAYNIFLCEIFRIRPGSEFFSAKVDGVRSRRQRSQKRVSAARRREKFGKPVSAAPHPFFSL